MSVVEGLNGVEYSLSFSWEKSWGTIGVCLAEGNAEDIKNALASPELTSVIINYIRKEMSLKIRHKSLLEIPEGKTSLIGDDCNFSYKGLYEYDIIDKLVFPSTLRLETVPQEQYEPIINFSYELRHLQMYFSSYESPGFMDSSAVRAKRVQIGEIENHSPYICIEDGVIYNADKSRLIFCYQEKTEFTVPDSVKIIESQAFCGQTKLRRITLPDGLDEIHDSAFIGCTSLEAIVIPEGVTRINVSTFNGCVSLSDVNLPSGLKHLGEDAFRHCDALVEINLPDSIESMNSFECCEALKRIVIPKGVTYIKGFAMCHSLKQVVLHEGVRRIDDYAFRFCENLSDINFPEGLKVIGARAFYPSSLTKVVFPTTLKKIECEAFYHNRRLRYIRFNSDVEIAQAAFACTPNKKIIRKLSGLKIPSNVFEEDKSLDKFGFWD